MVVAVVQNGKKNEKIMTQQRIVVLCMIDEMIGRLIRCAIRLQGKFYMIWSSTTRSLTLNSQRSDGGKHCNLHTGYCLHSINSRLRFSRFVGRLIQFVIIRS